MFGGRSKHPASKTTVILSGAFLSIMGALFLVGMIIGEPAPDVSILALMVGFVLAGGGFTTGILMLITGLRMKE